MTALRWLRVLDVPEGTPPRSQAARALSSRALAPASLRGLEAEYMLSRAALDRGTEGDEEVLIMLGFYSGNDMLARGALHAGCRFFAGYPITPATSILVSMVNEMPTYGGLAIEAEDEIAAIGFCIGAAMAGEKAMTATSGPGISLYSENIGLAIAAEIPLVIVDVQRHGPATGSATQTA